MSLSDTYGQLGGDIEATVAKIRDAVLNANDAVINDLREDIGTLNKKIADMVWVSESHATTVDHSLADLQVQIDKLTQRLDTMGTGGDTEDPGTDAPPPDIEPTPIEKTTVTNFKPESGHTYHNLEILGGIDVVHESINDVAFVDCSFREASTLVKIQGQDDGKSSPKTVADYRIKCERWSFTRCVFHGATPEASEKHSHGAYLEGYDDFTFTDCRFSLNGWFGTERSAQNHNVYISAGGKTTFDNCMFSLGSQCAIKSNGCSDLNVRNCTFQGNIMDISVDMRNPSGKLVVYGDNKFTGTGGTDSDGKTLAWSIDIRQTKGDTGTVDSVVIAGASWDGPGVTDGTRWSGAKAIRIVGELVKQAVVKNCDLSNWSGERLIENLGDRITLSTNTGL